MNYNWLQKSRDFPTSVEKNTIFKVFAELIARAGGGRLEKANAGVLPTIKKRGHKIKTIKKSTPGRAIRTFCVKCVGGVLGDIKNCGGHGENPLFDYCHFYPYRMGRGRPSVKIIRKSCLQCMGGSTRLVRECTTIGCKYWPYRMGKNPKRAGKGQSAERMAVIRSKKRVVSLQFALQNQRSAIG